MSDSFKINVTSFLKTTRTKNNSEDLLDIIMHVVIYFSRLNV